jgi:Family of unknown function (DUF5681)
MSDHSEDDGCGDSEVGYGKPPQRTRFRKGQSGNPGGRPRGVTAGRAKALALKEAYRMVRVKVGESTAFVPAIQAILRSQVALAAKGNGPAQRAVIEKIQAIEQELALEAAAEAAETKATEKPIPDRELARRIAWILSGEVPKRSPGADVEDDETCSADGENEKEQATQCSIVSCLPQVAP